MSRRAELARTTKETDVRVVVDLDGSGVSEVSTGVGFFDHMLELFARHALLDLTVATTGDLQTGSHHTVEDTGIVLGQAIDSALGDRAGIERYASVAVPMDESLAQAAIDISGRPLLVMNVPLQATTIGGFEADLLQEFMRALATNCRMTLHLNMEPGGNPHHMIEGCVKAVARALRIAVGKNPRISGVPSTKGSL